MGFYGLLPAFGLVGLMLCGSAAQGMTFKVIESENCTSGCVTEIHATGTIELDTYKEFLRLKVRHKNILVRFDSPGGKLYGGIRLGEVLRAIGASTAVRENSYCESACVFAFLGGVRRTVPAGTRIGVHQSMIDAASYRSLPDEGKKEVDQAILTLQKTYISRMGANPGLVTVSNRTLHSAINYLSQERLRYYRVITDHGSRQPVARPASRKAPKRHARR